MATEKELPMQAERIALMSRPQAAIARELEFAAGGVHRDTAYLGRRAGTTAAGAASSLRAMQGHGWATESITGNWSLTQPGREALDAQEGTDYAV
jgi:hypothetical protein